MDNIIGEVVETVVEAVTKGRGGRRKNVAVAVVEAVGDVVEAVADCDADGGKDPNRDLVAFDLYLTTSRVLADHDAAIVAANDAIDQYVANDGEDNGVRTDLESDLSQAEDDRNEAINWQLGEVYSVMTARNISFAAACKRLTKGAVKDAEAQAKYEAREATKGAKKAEREKAAKLAKAAKLRAAADALAAEAAE